MVRKTNIICYCLCGILKKDTNELSYKTEIDAQIQKTNLWSPVGEVHACSVMHSLQPNLLQPTRPLCLRDFPGKNTGVHCYFLLRGSSRLRDGTCVSGVSCIAGSFFTTEPPEKPHQREKEGNKLGALDQHIYTNTYVIDNQQGPTLHTGNYTQYFVITIKGKEYEKEYITVLQT